MFFLRASGNLEHPSIDIYIRIAEAAYQRCLHWLVVWAKSASSETTHIFGTALVGAVGAACSWNWHLSMFCQFCLLIVLKASRLEYARRRSYRYSRGMVAQDTSSDLVHFTSSKHHFDRQFAERGAFWCSVIDNADLCRRYCPFVYNLSDERIDGCVLQTRYEARFSQSVSA